MSEGLTRSVLATLALWETPIHAELHQESVAAHLALLADLDARGLLDWTTPLDEEGRPFLPALVALQPRLEVVQWATRHKGLGVLTWDADQDLLAETLERIEGKRPRHAPKYTTYTHGDVSVAAHLIRVAPLALLCAQDAPDAPSVGHALFQRLVALNSGPLLAAAHDRGLDAAGPEAQQALLQDLRASNFQAVLRTGLDLRDEVTIAEGWTRPLWAHALDSDRGEELKELLAGRSDMPTEQAWVNLSASIKRPSDRPSKDTLLGLLKALPEGLATRDDLGRPAGWRAATLNAGLFREMLAAEDKGIEVLRATDTAGHGPLFHLFPLLQDENLHRTQLGRELGTFIGAGREVLDGRGLIAQWFEDPTTLQRWPLLQPFSKIFSAGWDDNLFDEKARHRFRFTRLGTAAQMWDMPPEAVPRVAQTLLKASGPMSNGLAGFYVDLSDQPPGNFGKNPRPWVDLAERHAAWPALRGVMALLIVRRMAVREKDTQGVILGAEERVLERLMALPWLPVPGLQEAFIQVATHSPPRAQRQAQAVVARLQSVAIQEKAHLLPPSPRRRSGPRG